MATKVKSKIQRLLKQLDQDEGGSSTSKDLRGLLDEATDETEMTDPIAAGAAGYAGQGRGAAYPDASDSSFGVDASSDAPHAMDDTSSTATPSMSSLDTTPSHPGRRPLPQPYQNIANAEKHAQMERKAMQLMADNRNLQAAFAEAMARKNAEVAELQAHLAGTVRELAARQQELEATAPLLRLRLEDFRNQLSDLRVSDAAYKELQLLPKDARTPLDEVKIAVHAALQDSRAEHERLATALASAREAACRADEAAAKARNEAARTGAALAEREKDLSLVTEGMQARIDRLASELEGAMVSAQLSSAKGAMYDELRAKYDAAVAENQRLAVIEATFKRLEAQAAADRATATQKEHTFEMLMMDKAYLSKQVDFMSDQQRKLEAELELREKKINELSRHKSDLWEKLMAAQTLKGRDEEARLQKDLATLQERTHADLERIRVETAEAYEREARLLRELRDGAQEDALRAKTALSELQSQHEKSSLAHAEVAKRLEQQVVQLQTELKQRAFELSHFRVVVSEKEQLVGRANMQIELLQDKLNVLMDKYRSLEVEHNSHVNKALVAAAEVVANGGARHGASADAASGPGGEATAPAKLQIDHALLKQERDLLAKDVESLQARLRSAQETLKLAAQPHAFLLEELEAVKLRCAQAETKVAALQVALQAKSSEAEALQCECNALRGDLDGLLSQRQALEGMKAVVVKALAGGLPQVQQAAAMAAASRRPPPPFGQTTIIGEGGLSPAPPLPVHLTPDGAAAARQAQGLGMGGGPPVAATPTQHR